MKTIEFKRRWRGRSVKEVSKSMTLLAEGKAKRMTKAQRTAHAQTMVAGRGKHWRINSSGKREYYDE